MDESQVVTREVERIQRPSKVSILSVSLTVVAAVVLYAAMATVAEWRIFRATLDAIPMKVWFEVIVLSLLSYSARFLRWHGFLGRLGYRIPTRRSLDIYLSGFAMTLSPGKAGEIIRSIYLRPYGIGYPESIGAFVAERLLDLLAVGVLSSLTMWAIPEQQPRILGAVSVCIVLILMFRSKLTTYLTMRLERRALGAQGAKGVSVVKCLFSDVRLVGAIALSFFAWTAQGFSLYLIVDALGYELQALGIIGIYCLSILAGAASFIPGGLGATELAIAYSLGAVGLNRGDAIAASLVSRGLTLWLALGIGVWATLRIATGVRYIYSKSSVK